MDLAHALGEYLDYLAVERGSSPTPWPPTGAT